VPSATSGIQSASDDLLASTRIGASTQQAVALPSTDNGTRLESAGQSAGGAAASVASATASVGAAVGATAGATGRVGVPAVDMSGVTRGTAGLGAAIGGALGGLSGRMPQIR
jgi:hypothetical protein